MNNETKTVSAPPALKDKALGVAKVAGKILFSGLNVPEKKTPEQKLRRRRNRIVRKRKTFWQSIPWPIRWFVWFHVIMAILGVIFAVLFTLALYVQT